VYDKVKKNYSKDYIRVRLKAASHMIYIYIYIASVTYPPFEIVTQSTQQEGKAMNIGKEKSRWHSKIQERVGEELPSDSNDSTK